ncbi:MAG: GrpB family protein [Actinocatenispora sp.]
MPFPDERVQVSVIDHRPGWAAEFGALADVLRGALGEGIVGVDHVGSTSVPGLPAKDCIDIQVRVPVLDEPRITALFGAIGFRCRPEPWNRTETSAGREYRKLVFAPPVGARSCNVHVRESGGGNARYALLFRDFLRADDDARRAWGAFKQRLARSVPDLMDYGQIKAPATDILMAAAERWARDTGWGTD